MNFSEPELFIKTYIPTKAMLFTKQVELIRKKEFTIVHFNLQEKNFVFLMTRLVNINLSIHLF